MYISQCNLDSMSFGQYIHLRKDSKQDCPKVLVNKCEVISNIFLKNEGGGLNFLDKVGFCQHQQGGQAPRRGESLPVQLERGPLEEVEVFLSREEDRNIVVSDSLL